MKELTLHQAKQAMRQHKKVTHRYFSDHEYLTCDENGREITEEGYFLDATFWALRISDNWIHGWRLFD